LARVRDDCFFGAVDLLQNGIKYITEHQIKRKVYQLLANKATQLEARASAAHVKLDSEIMGKSLGRLPFITREGNLVLSSEHVKRGDFIALIRGAQVPFVLRRQSGEIYQLISEAYVDGIMDGEVIE
ncbi:putative heterokaryon incompatibility protein 6, OR allele, partial [Eremomyces bilateralis CBS 781.70]